MFSVSSIYKTKNIFHYIVQYGHINHKLASEYQNSLRSKSMRNQLYLSTKHVMPNRLRLIRIKLNSLATCYRRGVLHPFYLAPYAEYPLLLGFGLYPFMEANINYLHEGFMGLVAEPTFLLLLLCLL